MLNRHFAFSCEIYKQSRRSRYSKHDKHVKQGMQNRWKADRQTGQRWQIDGRQGGQKAIMYGGQVQHGSKQEGARSDIHSLDSTM